MLVVDWLNAWNYYRGDVMKQTLFKNDLHDEIRVQELNHKLDKNQREREAFRKSQQEKYKQWLKEKGK